MFDNIINNVNILIISDYKIIDSNRTMAIWQRIKKIASVAKAKTKTIYSSHLFTQDVSWTKDLSLWDQFTSKTVLSSQLPFSTNAYKTQYLGPFQAGYMQKYWNDSWGADTKTAETTHFHCLR